MIPKIAKESIQLLNMVETKARSFAGGMVSFPRENSKAVAAGFRQLLYG